MVGLTAYEALLCATAVASLPSRAVPLLFVKDYCLVRESLRHRTKERQIIDVMGSNIESQRGLREAQNENFFLAATFRATGPQQHGK